MANIAIDVSTLNTFIERNIAKILTLNRFAVERALQHFTPYLNVQHSVPLEVYAETTNSRRYDGEFVGGSIGAITERFLSVYPIVYELSDEPERLRDKYRVALAGGLDATQNPFELWIVQQGIINASQDLYNVIFSAVRSTASGNKTIAEAFDGITKILTDAITAGGIAAGKNNYTALTGAFSASNTIDRMLAAWRATDVRLREAGAVIFCSTTVGEMYDDNYKATHDAPPLVDTAGQTTLEGTSGMAKIVRLSNMPNDYIMITRAENVRWGTDKMSDMKALKAFNSGNPYLFTATMKYVFGLQFHTFDNRMFYLSKVTA